MKAKKVTEPEKTYVSQYCLGTLYLKQFLNSLPKDIHVSHIAWRATLRKGRQKLAIPEYLKKTGITSASIDSAPTDIRGSYPLISSKEGFLFNIAKLSRHYQIPIDKFFVVRVTLMDRGHTSSISFKRMYKQIRLPNDRRHKKLVLGMTKHDGKDHLKMLAKLSATKITCTMMKTERTIVMCSEEVAMR